MIGGGTSIFAFSFVDLIKVGLFFCPFALEGVFTGPRKLLVGGVWVGGKVLAGPGEQSSRMMRSR